MRGLTGCARRAKRRCCCWPLKYDRHTHNINATHFACVRARVCACAAESACDNEGARLIYAGKLRRPGTDCTASDNAAAPQSHCCSQLNSYRYLLITPTSAISKYSDEQHAFARQESTKAARLSGRHEQLHDTPACPPPPVYPAALQPTACVTQARQSAPWGGGWGWGVDLVL